MTTGQPLSVASIAAGAEAVGVGLSDLQAEALLQYAELLLKWNKVYNLTSLRDPGEVLTLHLIDSLSGVASLRRAVAGREPSGPTGCFSVMDVGSGGGLPGVVLAVACPELHVTCVDTVAKKAAFIQQVAAQLPRAALAGRLVAKHARVESVQATFDVITSRAFASLSDFALWSRQALGEGGLWMAMKGVKPEAEIAALPPWVEAFHVEHLSVEGLGAQRCIVWMRDRGPQVDVPVTN